MSKELSISDMEKILLKDPNIVDIHYPETWDFPKIRYNIWNEESRKERKKDIKYLKEYLNYPCIEDIFDKDHLARIKWTSDIALKYSWFKKFYYKNALRISLILAYSSKIYKCIRGYVGTNSSELKNLIEETADILKTKYHVNAYNDLSTNDKLKYVMDIKKGGYKILEFLSQQKPS